MKTTKILTAIALTTGVWSGAFIDSASAQFFLIGGAGSSNNQRDITFEINPAKSGKISNIKFTDIPEDQQNPDADPNDIFPDGQSQVSQPEADVSASFIEVGFKTKIFEDKPSFGGDPILDFEKDFDFDDVERLNNLESPPGRKIGIVELQQELFQDTPSLSTGEAFVTIAKWIEYKSDLDFGELTFYLPLCDPTICDVESEFPDNPDFPVTLDFLGFDEELTEAPSDLLNVANLATRLDLPFELTGFLDPSDFLAANPSTANEIGLTASVYGLTDNTLDPYEREPFGMLGQLTRNRDFDMQFGIPITLQPIPTVPEPSALASLFALGAFGSVSMLKRR